MGTDPGIAMQPSDVADYKPQPPQPPKSSADQFMSGLAGGQELSMADIAATDRAGAFTQEASQKIRAHVYAADNSVQRYAQTEEASRQTFMTIQQSEAAQIGPVHTDVVQLGPMRAPTAFMGPAPTPAPELKLEPGSGGGN